MITLKWTKWAAVVGLGALIVVLAGPRQAAAQTADELKRQIDTLIRQLDTLSKRVQDMEKKPSDVGKLEQKIKKMEASTKPARRGMLRIPGTNTSIKLGGFIQTDVQLDLGGAGGGPSIATFSAGNIALEDATAKNTSGSNNHLRFIAQNSRFNFETFTKTPKSDSIDGIKVFFEMDFRGELGSQTITNSHKPRLRHGYGEVTGPWGKLRVGQSWSNAFAFIGGAPTISWVGSAGSIFARQAQVMYTTPKFQGWNVAVSLENPEVSIPNAPEGAGDLNDIVPDFIAKASWRGKWGGFDIGGMARYLNVDRLGVSDSQVAGGAFAAVKVFTFGKDYIAGYLAAGSGMGRYMDAGTSEGHFVDGKIKLTDNLGAKMGYQYNITPTWNVVFAGGIEHMDSPTGFTGDPNEVFWSTHLNTRWFPFEAKPRTWVGVEWAHGFRETESGAEGVIDRIHLSMNFPF